MRNAILIALTFVCMACSPPAAEPAPTPQAEVAAVTPAAASPAPGQSRSFMAPSGNIGCVFTPAGGTEIYETPDGRAELVCDRVEPTYVRIILSEQSAARVIEDSGEQGCCSGETIAYGSRWAEGPFTCDITEAGVACANTIGNGFTLSRTRVEAR